ncbi:MAG: DUF924 domain-containing protein [Deltaproteobacteria bacterium]|nr:MAG: DUF924 domain-containing protein [Deltaproteobacteria bacterium]
MKEYSEILKFWFRKGPDQLDFSTWFKKDENFDREIKKRFSALIEQDPKDWQKEPEGTLGYIILLDQFSRNIYRGTPKSFAQDGKALEAAAQGIEANQDSRITFVQRIFFYMPFMHSEILSDQERSIELFRELFQNTSEEGFKSNYEYALAHHKIIEEFGRFPHRNEILGRKSTDAEKEFLKKPGSSF